MNGVRKLVGGQLAGKLVRGQRTAPANQEEEEEEEEEEEKEEKDGSGEPGGASTPLAATST